MFGIDTSGIQAEGLHPHPNKHVKKNTSLGVFWGDEFKLKTPGDVGQQRRSNDWGAIIIHWNPRRQTHFCVKLLQTTHHHTEHGKMFCTEEKNSELMEWRGAASHKTSSVARMHCKKNMNGPAQQTPNHPIQTQTQKYPYLEIAYFCIFNAV